MGRMIKSISVRKEDDKFLDDHGYSPSKIFARAVDEARERRLNPDKETNVIELHGKINRLSKLISKYARFVEQNGLIADFEGFEQ